ncbi:MAG: universal stress protein [Ktedonobacterales bacterium]
MDAEYGKPETTPGDDALSSFTGRETLPPPKLLSRVLVPVDDTRESEATLPYATLLGKELHAHLSLGCVQARALVRGEAKLIGPEAHQRQDVAHVFAYLAQLREQLPASGSPVDAFEIGAHSVVEGLIELESSCHADLVLVALGRHNIANHRSLGRVVDTLIQKGSAPVMAIPPRARDRGSHPVTVRHILVPLDGSALAEQALALLRGWLSQTQPEKNSRLAVTLLGVAEKPETLQHYQSYLDSVRMALLDCPECALIPNVVVQAEALVGSSAPGTIVDAVEQNIFGESFRSEPTDLLIMATHGRGGMGRWLLGSVASYVLPRVHVPVLLVHPAFLDT